MSEQIYIFNPEHDLCVANGDENFVPPRSAEGFAKENMDLSEYLERPNKQRRQIIPGDGTTSLRNGSSMMALIRPPTLSLRYATEPADWLERRSCDRDSGKS